MNSQQPAYKVFGRDEQQEWVVIDGYRLRETAEYLAESLTRLHRRERHQYWVEPKPMVTAPPA